MRFKRMHRSERGVTLVEMTIVAVIIGVMAAMSVPQFAKEIPRMRAKAAVRDVVSEFRSARSMAIAEKLPCGVSFDQNGTACTLFIDKYDLNDHSYGYGDSLVTQTKFSKDVQVNYQTFPKSAVVFQPDGSASGSGVVSMSTHDYSLSYTVDVLASTGRVRMVEGYSPPS